jgi:hypothetical protein
MRFEKPRGKTRLFDFQAVFGKRIVEVDRIAPVKARLAEFGFGVFETGGLQKPWNA